MDEFRTDDWSGSDSLFAVELTDEKKCPGWGWGMGECLAKLVEQFTKDMFLLQA
jgi:hypothetical protein